MLRQVSQAPAPLLGLIFLACCAAGLAGCSRSPAPAAAATASFHAGDISFLPPLEFSLTGPSGAAVTAADLRGRITLLYFGYTHCPDVCPTTLADLAQVLKRFGPQAEAVRVLFVSVDPQRDTPQLLQRYTAAFAPQIIGLTGTDAQLTALAKRYRVAYRRDAPGPDGSYAVYHSSAVFIFDRSGKARLLPPASETTPQMAQDLTTLMN